ncbi:MAG TPA: hypothetical protein VJM11_09915 [Nevskiaceae bacterium]|nr:hypothetical protein [Nevskiaceae bacterium]
MASRSHRRRCIVASLLALFAYLALPGAHLLQSAHQARGALELAFCGASPALVAKLKALPNAAPLLDGGIAESASDDRDCWNPSVFVGSLAIGSRPFTPDWSAWRHEAIVGLAATATREAASRQPRARGPPL